MQDIISKKSIGDRLKSLRIENNLSQAQASEALGLSRSHYSQVELGKQFPSYAVLSKVAEFYHKDYEWILHGHPSQIAEVDAGSDLRPDDMDNIDSNQSPDLVSRDPLGREVGLVKSEDLLMYLKHRLDNVFIEALPKIYLPFQQLSRGPYRAFQVEGDIPDISYFDQDVVIGEWIEDKYRVVISRVYVIVLEDQIFINKIQAFYNNGYLECQNSDGMAEQILVSSILELWEVKVKITFRLPKLAIASPTLYKHMEKAIQELTQEVNRLKM